MLTSQVTYNLYQQLAVDGLKGLANFNVNDMVSPQSQCRRKTAANNT